MYSYFITINYAQTCIMVLCCIYGNNGNHDVNQLENVRKNAMPLTHQENCTTNSIFEFGQTSSTTKRNIFKICKFTQINLQKEDKALDQHRPILVLSLQFIQTQFNCRKMTTRKMHAQIQMHFPLPNHGFRVQCLAYL